MRKLTDAKKELFGRGCEKYFPWRAVALGWGAFCCLSCLVLLPTRNTLARALALCFRLYDEMYRIVNDDATLELNDV